MERSSCVAISCRDRNTYSASQINSVCRIEGVTGLMRNRSMPASSHCRRCPASVQLVTAIMKQSFKRACWHLSSYLKTTHVGHHDVEQQHIGLVCGGECQTGLSVVRPPDIVSP